MIVGDNRYLYVGNGSALRYIAPDGTGNEITTIIPTDCVIKCFSKTGTHLIIYVEKYNSNASSFPMGDCYAYFWNYASVRADSIKKIDDNSVTAAGIYQGYQYCFTTGKPTDYSNALNISRLHFLDGTEYRPIFSFPDTVSLNAHDIHNNMLHFLSKDTLYTVGDQYLGFQQIVNSIGYIPSGASGFCKSLNDADICFSCGSSASLALMTYGNSVNTFDANAQWRGVVVDPIFPMNMKGQLSQVEISFKEKVDSANSLKLYFKLDTDYNNSSLTTILNGLTSVTANKKIIYQGLDYAGATLPSFNSIKPIIYYAAGSGNTEVAKINYIKLYYEFIPIVL